MSKAEDNQYSLPVNVSPEKYLQWGKQHSSAMAKDLWDSTWTQTAKPELEHLRWNWKGEKNTGKGGLFPCTSDLQARSKTALLEAGNEGRTQCSRHVPTLDLLWNENNSWENTMYAFPINNIYTSLKWKHGHWFVTTLSSSEVCISWHSNHFLIKGCPASPSYSLQCIMF